MTARGPLPRSQQILPRDHERSAGDLTGLTAHYPALRHLLQEMHPLGSDAQWVNCATGDVLFREGDSCAGFPFLLEGEVRVSHSSPDGRSLELYRVAPGEWCLLSTASMFKVQPMLGEGVVTRSVCLLLVKPSLFRSWLDFAPFRDEVLCLFAQRMADLTSLVDAVAFQQLDQRLAKALLGRGPKVQLTHQALADELGTVREMVTRLLKRFERQGWVELSREQIVLRDQVALDALARGRAGAIYR